VVTTLVSSFKENIELVPPGNLNDAVRLLKGLGHQEEAQTLLALYAERRNVERDMWDLEKLPFGDSVSDPDVRTTFQSKLATFDETPIDPVEVLLGISERQSWHDRDVAALAALPIDKFYALFKSERGPRLRGIISASVKARAALQRIGTESKINAMRVRRLGVVVEDQAPPATERP
jgi:hypothetical protein